MHPWRDRVPTIRDHVAQLEALCARGDLTRIEVEGTPYLALSDAPPPAVPDRVRLLAPFDPLVWDRERFEHLWGWRYRFEAYTPRAERVRGYYAMPLLWRDQVVGWAKDAGLDKTEYRAIRALADYLPQSELDDEKEAHLLEFEETIAGKDPYRTFGRYYQFCLTKPA